MSQPPSPSLTSRLSSFDIQDDDHLQQRSAISDSARQERLVALERRLNTTTTESPDLNTAQSSAAQEPQPFDANHVKRVEFRRLVDPGITRPNSKEVALRSLRVNL